MHRDDQLEFTLAYSHIIVITKGKEGENGKCEGNAIYFLKHVFVFIIDICIKNVRSSSGTQIDFL
jgi:hypothetical protein